MKVCITSSRWGALAVALAVSFWFLPIPSAYCQKRILILGDSLTAGYGIAEENSFPAQLEKMLIKEGHKDIKIHGDGEPGATSRSGLSRLNWRLKGKEPYFVLVLSLGANDMLRGLSIEETRKNLRSILDRALSQPMKVLLVGMKAPPNYGKAYGNEFENMYKDLAKTLKVPLVPFLLEGVGGEKSLNQADGIHPNEKGHEKMAQNIKKYLLPLL